MQGRCSDDPNAADGPQPPLRIATSVPCREQEGWLTIMKVNATASPGVDDRPPVETVENVAPGGPSFRPPGDAGNETEVPIDEEDATTVDVPWEAPEKYGPDVRAVFSTQPAPGDSETSSVGGVGDTPLPFRGQIIAVVSPKGGMGKTTVATNLGVGLATLAPMSVVLVDADVQFGDVATALALEPVYSLPDAVSDVAASDPLILKTFLTPHPSGFFTICGAASPIDGDRVTGDQLSHLLSQLSKVFRYVVAICGMSVTSARGLRKHLEVLSTIGIMPAERHVVLNSTDRYSGLSVRDVEATTGVYMDVAIPRSKAVVLSSNRGIPVLLNTERNPAWRAFSALVRRFDPSVDRTHGRHLRTVALK
jgi:MinD-like ATPase involved in chromosome partitioning or flagellar assembly